MHTVCIYIYIIFLHRYRSMINIQHRLVPKGYATVKSVFRVT